MSTCDFRSSMKLAGNSGIGGYSLSSTTVTPPPPWWSGAGPKLDTNGCARRNSATDRAQLPGAVAVDDPDAPQLRHHRLVEESLDPRQRFVRRAADHVQIRPIDASRGCSSTCTRTRAGAGTAGAGAITRRSSTRARIRLPRTSTSAAPSCIDCDDAFEAERPDRDAIADRRRPAAGRRAAPRIGALLRLSQPLADRFERRAGVARAPTRCRRSAPAAPPAARRRQRSTTPVSSANRRSASISRRASRIRSSSRWSRRLLNVSSRSRSSCSRALHPRSTLPAASGARARRAAARDRAPACRVRSWPGARRAALSRSLRCARASSMMSDRQAEPRRDFEREAAARAIRTSADTSARRSRVEAEARRRHALGRRRIRLQRVEVRRRHHHRAAPPEVIDDRHRRARRPRSGRCRCRPRRAARAPASPASSSIATMFAMWPENVLRLVGNRLLVADVGEHDRNTGTCVPSAAGISSPACAISGSSPAVFSATVLPPVFGPGDQQHPRRRNQQDVDRNHPAPRLNQQRMPRRLAARAGRRPKSPARCRRWPSSSAPWPAARRASWPHRPCAATPRRDAGTRRQPEQNPPDLFGLLLLERDDVVVDLDRAERLQDRGLRRCPSCRARCPESPSGVPTFTTST